MSKRTLSSKEPANDNQPAVPDQLDNAEAVERLDRLRSIGLPVALGASVVIVLLLTSISMGLYFSSNLSRIDLSKPKNAEVRQQLQTASRDEDDDYDNEGPVTQEALQQAAEQLKQRRKQLRKLGDFTSPILSDKELGITDRRQ